MKNTHVAALIAFPALLAAGAPMASAKCLNLNVTTVRHLTQVSTTDGRPGRSTGRGGVTTHQWTDGYCIEGSEAWFQTSQEPEVRVPLGSTVAFNHETSAGSAIGQDSISYSRNVFTYRRQYTINSNSYGSSYVQFSGTVRIFFDGTSCRILSYNQSNTMALRNGSGLGNFTGTKDVGRGTCYVSG